MMQNRQMNKMSCTHNTWLLDGIFHEYSCYCYWVASFMNTLVIVTGWHLFSFVNTPAIATGLHLISFINNSAIVTGWHLSLS